MTTADLFILAILAVLIGGVFYFVYDWSAPEEPASVEEVVEAADPHNRKLECPCSPELGEDD
jgi:hypothetical protein